MCLEFDDIHSRIGDGINKHMGCSQTTIVRLTHFTDARWMVTIAYRATANLYITRFCHFDDAACDI